MMIDPILLPRAEEAVSEYENAGGNLTVFSQFGIDPLRDFPILKHQRESQLSSNLDFDNIFHCLVNGNQQPFMYGLLYFINLNDRLAASMN